MLTRMWILFCVTIIALLLQTKAEVHNPPACEIFCRGKILEVVQNAQIFPDCKEFVDMSIKLPVKTIYHLFDTMMNNTKGKPLRVQVRRFVRRCFADVGSDVHREQPTDWVRTPKMFINIRDRHLREWAEDLVYMWKRFARRVNPAVRQHPDMYSMIYVPNIIMVPGGRRREFYYWDSYWIILGLLRSEMYQTVKGMITNYLILIETYGYVPNSGRIYSLTRSNFPLLIPMVNEYYSVTKDKDFIKKNIAILEKEFNFWLKNRIVEVTHEGTSLTAARYIVNATEPRPEAYKHDEKAARMFETPESKREFFKNLIAACESGWDFSSRWFVCNDVTKGNVTHTKISSIVPVDLNAVLCWNARILKEFYTILEMPDKASTFKMISSRFQKSIDELMWNEEDGIWYDYDMVSNQTRKNFYASNVFPLWTQCYDTERKDYIGSKVAKYLKSFNIDTYKGGVPSSFLHSNLFWDYPNAIAPIQHVIIAGLQLTGNKEALDLAFKLAYNWIHSTYMSFIFTKAMYDKYNAEVLGGQGKDMQSRVTIGYGWTNGVCLELLSIYGKDIAVFKNWANLNCLSPIIFQITLLISIHFCGANSEFY